MRGRILRGIRGNISFTVMTYFKKFEHSPYLLLTPRTLASSSGAMAPDSGHRSTEPRVRA